MEAPMSMDSTNPAPTLSRVLPTTRYAAPWLKIDPIRAKSSVGEGKKVGEKNSDTTFHNSRRPTNDRRPGNRSGLEDFTGSAFVTARPTRIYP
jgi:hypothetical protein